jgi:hypothetical protein
MVMEIGVEDRDVWDLSPPYIHDLTRNLRNSQKHQTSTEDSLAERVPNGSIHSNLPELDSPPNRHT